jgi:hypothetical protein
MKRVVLLLVLAIASPGCIIRHEEGAGGYYDSQPTSSEARACARHDDCHAGCYCDLEARRCHDSDICTKDSDCHAGFRCDGRSSCVPREAPPVADGGAASRGNPADTGASPSNVGDAGALGPDALSCDAGAAGTGSCAPRCKFDQQCASGGRCQEGQCQRPCTASGSCGTGAVCQDGYCTSDSSGGGQCVYASQCGTGGACINGYCHAGCAGNADCPNHADVCDRGVCRPDERPLPACTGNAQCVAGQSCVDGLCRLGCGCDADCTPWGVGTVCARGFCASPAEGVR